MLEYVRHTNALVIADHAFPFWPEIETVDISLSSGVPTVLEVFRAIQPEFHIARAYMAREFRKHNASATRDRFARALAGVRVTFEPHVKLKQRVPAAIGLIRTGDTVPYANMILVSG